MERRTEIRAFVRKLMMLALAGLPAAVSSVLNDHVLTFLNRAGKLQLSPLRTGEIEACYTDGFHSAGLSVTETQTRRAAAAGGSPYLMQLIGHYVLLPANAGDAVSDQQMDRAIERAAEDFKNDVCETTLAALSDGDIRFLSAMAQDRDESAITDLAARLERGSAYVQTYKRRLLHSGVITQPRRGRVSFAVPYLRDHLRGREA